MDTSKLRKLGSLINEEGRKGVVSVSDAIKIAFEKAIREGNFPETVKAHLYVSFEAVVTDFNANGSTGIVLEKLHFEKHFPGKNSC